MDVLGLLEDFRIDVLETHIVHGALIGQVRTVLIVTHTDSSTGSVLILTNKVSALSGGERKRLYLVRLLLENPNFLVLDEPTNDFDIFTMNILEQFLEHYEGCLLLVSHDRYFMDKTVDSLFIMEENGDISGFVGKCSEYIEYREEQKQALRTVTEPAEGVADKTAVSENEKKKLSFKEQKEFEQLNEEIPTLEAEQKALEEKMASADFEEVRKAGERYKEIERLLEEKYPRWEELAERA